MKRILALVLIVVSIFALAGCGSKWRQKMTVTVMTPQGEISGSAVSEVSFLFRDQWGGIIIGDGRYYQSSIRGEATVIDLGSGRYLFATLDYERGDTLAFDTLFPNAEALANPDGTNGYPHTYPESKLANQITPSLKPANVPRRLYPTLVTFTDLSNPKSVKLVDPANLAATFGGGYALKSITLEITDDPETKGRIEKLLSWLGEFDDRQFDGSKYHDVQNTNISNNLMSGHFVARGM
jgi:hypothetical protein